MILMPHVAMQVPLEIDIFGDAPFVFRRMVKSAEWAARGVRVDMSDCWRRDGTKRCHGLFLSNATGHKHVTGIKTLLIKYTISEPYVKLGEEIAKSVETLFANARSPIQLGKSIRNNQDEN